MSLGERIKYLRTEKDMTQEELGKLLSVGKSTISQYESNKSTPDAATISKIADIFNTTTDYLLGRANDLSPDKQEDETEFFPIGFASRGDISIKKLKKIIKEAIKEVEEEKKKEEKENN